MTVKTEKYEVVPMDKVPNPPASLRRGRRREKYLQIRALGLDGSKALRIPCASKKNLCNTRTQLQEMARRDGRVLLTGRNGESTVLWAWMVRKDAE